MRYSSLMNMIRDLKQRVVVTKGQVDMLNSCIIRSYLLGEITGLQVDELSRLVDSIVVVKK